MVIWWLLGRKVKKRLEEKRKKIEEEVDKAKRLGYREEDIFRQLPYREILYIRSVFQPTAEEELEKIMNDPQADPAKKKIAKELYARAGNPEHAAPLNALIGAELLHKDLHKDPHAFTRELIKRSLTALYHYHKKYRHLDQDKAEEIALAKAYLGDLYHILDFITENVDPRYKPYMEALYKAWDKAIDNKKMTPEEAVETLKKHLQEQGIPTDWLQIDKSPEAAKAYLLPEPPPPGTGILTRPDRYPALTQKVLLKALILGESNNDVSIYEAFHQEIGDVTRSPLAFSYWTPLIYGWLSMMDSGRIISPLRYIVQLLRLDPDIKSELYKLLDGFEKNGSIGEGFSETIERVKQGISRRSDPDKSWINRLVLVNSLEEALTALAGLVDDLSKLYLEKITLWDIWFRSDILLAVRLARINAGDGYMDPDIVSTELSSLIERFVPDPLVRRGYMEIIDHYHATIYRLPYGEGLAESLRRDEKSLLKKLKELRLGERALNNNTISAITSFYRYLILSTLAEKDKDRLLSSIPDQLKLHINNSVVLPVHGSVAGLLHEVYGDLLDNSGKDISTYTGLVRGFILMNIGEERLIHRILGYYLGEFKKTSWLPNRLLAEALARIAFY